MPPVAGPNFGADRAANPSRGAADWVVRGKGGRRRLNVAGIAPRQNRPRPVSNLARFTLHRC